MTLLKETVSICICLQFFGKQTQMLTLVQGFIQRVRGGALMTCLDMYYPFFNFLEANYSKDQNKN